MGIVNTGNFISFGNDSHCEFLITACSDENTPVNRNVDLSKNNFRFLYWDLDHFSNNKNTYKFAPYSILSRGWTTGWSYPTNYTVAKFNLGAENFAVDCWFAKSDANLITSDTNDFFYFGGILDGTLKGFAEMLSGFTTTLTGFTFGITHQSATNFQLDFNCVFPQAAGNYSLTYNLGAYSTFTAREFHHAAAVKHDNYLLLLYDGEVVVATNTITTKRFAFVKHRFDFLMQSDTSQEYFIDEFRYSKNIRRFWSVSTGKQWAIPNRSYTSKYRIFGTGQVRAGHGHNIVLDSNSKIWMWGRNAQGEIGVGNTNQTSTPISVIGAPKVICRIDAASGAASFGIDNAGRVWSWGYNPFGGLGDGSAVDKCTPISILGTNKTFCKIAGGYWHTFAITQNGSGWTWGYNNYGQLGDNTVVSKQTPIYILGARKTFCQISAGYYISHGITNGGRVWAWGYNNYGQLGDNSITNRCTPVSIYGINTKTFCQIDSGDYHTMAIDKNGKSWGWGYNSTGQLGTNSTVSKRTPISVVNTGPARTLCKNSAGQFHTVALDYKGLAWCWGYNGYGQVGDNSATNRSVPVSVLGNKKTFCAIAAGQNHTVAVDNHGYIWAWGRNDDYSELGMPDVTTSTRTPMLIVY